MTSWPGHGAKPARSPSRRSSRSPGATSSSAVDAPGRARRRPRRRAAIACGVLGGGCHGGASLRAMARLARSAPVGLSCCGDHEAHVAARRDDAPTRLGGRGRGDAGRRARAGCFARHRRDLWIVGLATLGALLALACWFGALGLVGHGVDVALGPADRLGAVPRAARAPRRGRRPPSGRSPSPSRSASASAAGSSLLGRLRAVRPRRGATRAHRERARPSPGAGGWLGVAIGGRARRRRSASAGAAVVLVAGRGGRRRCCSRA